MSDDADLERLDDATLRGIAYGRADSDSGRMRAERAARILADRENRARGAEALPSEAVPAPRNAVPTEAPAGLATVDTPEGEPAEPTEAAGARAWWVPRWRVAAVSLAVGALLGAGLAVWVPALVERTAPDSLAIFDRAPTARDDGQLAQYYGQEIGESRYLGRVGDVTLYAVRTTSEFIFGAGEGPQICVFATSEAGPFLPSGCTAEQIFRERGLSGTLVSFRTGSFASSTIDANRFIDVTWGPRGGVNARDVTDIVRAAETPAGDDDASGDNLAVTDLIRDRPADPTVAAALEPLVGPASHGPATIGDTDTDVGEAGATAPFSVFASIHPSAPRGGDEATVCLSVATADTVLGSSCAPVSTYSDGGLQVEARDIDLSAVVTLTPAGQVTVLLR